MTLVSGFVDCYTQVLASQCMRAQVFPCQQRLRNCTHYIYYINIQLPDHTYLDLTGAVPKHSCSVVLSHRNLFGARRNAKQFICMTDMVARQHIT